jgi:hypothetical protein
MLCTLLTTAQMPAAQEIFQQTGEGKSARKQHIVPQL